VGSDIDADYLMEAATRTRAALAGKMSKAELKTVRAGKAGGAGKAERAG
jgi:hypothetical protein